MTLFRNRYRIESARLPGWDYRANAWYFITICTRDRRHHFGTIDDEQMHLSKAGEIARRYWADIPLFSIGVRMDEFVVMPNHLHGIVVLDRTPEDQEILGINPNVETLQCNVSTRPTGVTRPTGTDEDDLSANMSRISPKTGSIAAIIRSYKSAVTRTVRRLGFADFGWQTRFYDKIIRHEEALYQIRAYIRENPARWVEDRENAMGMWM